MNENEFWKLIDSTLSDNQDKQYTHLKSELANLDRDELISFDHHYRTQLNKAFHWDLWAAAYIIRGGCSDDSFDYFCDWLISRGRVIFEAALDDPESLAALVTDDEFDFEEFRYAMGEVFEDKFDEQLPWDDTLQRAPEPAGDEWDEDTVEEKYPALAEAAAMPVPPADVSPRPTNQPRKYGLLIRLTILAFVILVFWIGFGRG